MFNIFPNHRSICRSQCVTQLVVIPKFKENGRSQDIDVADSFKLDLRQKGRSFKGII